MQTIASLVQRLDMTAQEALEKLRYMFYDVDTVESEITDEMVDLLIDIDSDPSVAEERHGKRLKEIQKARERNERLQDAARKAAAKRKAKTPPKKPGASAKDGEVEIIEGALPDDNLEETPHKESGEMAEILPEPAVSAPVDSSEPAPAVEPAPVHEKASTPEPSSAPIIAPTPAAPVVLPEAAAPVVPAPTVSAAASVPEEHHKPLAEILPPESPEEEAKRKEGRSRKSAQEPPAAPKAPAIKIGSAIEREDRVVEIVRADGTAIDAPEAAIDEAIQSHHAEVEEEEEELGVLAEAERRQEEEDRRKARLLAKPLPKPDPAVVAEVIRKAAERTQAAKAAKDKRRERDKEREREKVQIRTGAAAVTVVQQESEAAPGAPQRKTGKTARKRQKRVERARQNEDTMRRDAAAAIREYTAGAMGPARKRRRKRVREDGVADEVAVEAPELVEVEHGMTLDQFAQRIGEPVNDLILELMDLNMLVNKNEVLDLELMQKLALTRGLELQAVIPEEETVMAEEPDNPDDLNPRAPVITVMGHVDHGKTSLLDRIRSTHVVDGEAGGITQHIAAYDVTTPQGRVVFLDTPGHEAFTQMRARGAQATDIVVLVVAADDGIMPQTIEAIDHARAAEVPIVVAINKCDKANAQPDRIRQELTKFELVPEEWGGKTIMRNISALSGDGVSELVELLALEAEMLSLQANPTKRARGVIIESEIARGLGPVAWVLVQNGTLRVGDFFLAGKCVGRVRSIQDSHRQNLLEAGPATPVVVTGFDVPPDAGDEFVVVADERQARSVAEKREQLARAKSGQVRRHVTLEDFHAQMLAGEKKELNIVLKADVQGSVEVMSSGLTRLGNEKATIHVVHSGVGAINESDILLASASDAVVVGFHVSANPRARKLAEQEGVDIRTYLIIYEAIDAIKNALEGMLAPETKETITGHTEIREVFRSSALGNIAGCYQQDGETHRGSQARLLRDGVVIYTGRIASLRRGKDDAKSVAAGFECGIKLENFEDIHTGDIIEAYRLDSVAASLE